MIMDLATQFSNAQAITATAVSTNVIDLGAVRNIGSGEDLYLVLIVTTAFTDASSDSTVTPSLQTDDNEAFGSAATVRTYDTLAALSAAGTTRIYKLEPFTTAGIYERYIRLNYTVAGGNLSTGAITAFITKDVTTYRHYASGFSIQ